MTDLHPLTEEILEHIDSKNDMVDTAAIDKAVRARLDPKPVLVESGVKFPGLEDHSVAVSATFIESGNQMQMILVGTEPVLVVQPEYDAEEAHIDLVLTGVDITPIGLLPTLEVLLDAARTMAAQEQEQIDAYRADHPDEDFPEFRPVPAADQVTLEDEPDLSRKPDANGGSRVI